MKNDIGKLSNDWFRAEKKLFKELDKLPNAGCECDCDEPEVIQYIWSDGNWPEIMQRCLICGGDVGV
jgi:hypothetical protein